MKTKKYFAKKILRIGTIAFTLFFLLFLLSPLIKETAEAKEDKVDDKFTYTLLQPLPSVGGEKALSQNVTLKEYLSWAYKFTLSIAGFLAVLMIVIGGVEYIVSGANEGSRTSAKKRIENAMWGLFLALAAYLILYIINPALVDFDNNKFFKKKETGADVRPPILQNTPPPVLPN